MRHVMVLAGLVAALVGGCRPPAVTFPAEPLRRDGATTAYDTDGDGRGDFFLLAGADGRIDRIGYARGATDAPDASAGPEHPDEIVALDAVPPAHARHLLIVLDGYRHELIREMRRRGRLRVFHRPSRLVAPYPAMTDLAMVDMLATAPAPAFEALYFDRDANRAVGGGAAYLKGRNEPYNRFIDYRANLIWVPVFYLYPREAFRKDLHDAKRAFDRSDTREFVVYLSSTAGMGTHLGRDGQIEALRQVERLVLQILRESRGRTDVTLISDHGHGYTPVTRIDFHGELSRRGWRPGNRLTGPRDVVMTAFGVTTYASFYTHRRAELAEDLVTIEGVELASYADEASVVVLAPAARAGEPPQRAIIHRRDGRFRYEPTRGDPLALRELLAGLPGGADAFHDADALLTATVEHTWPAPLQRLWRAHVALVAHPPDVIASLTDDRCTGRKMFLALTETASTHGGLNRNNAVTFVMSTAGTLPPILRSRDVPTAMRTLLDAPVWPLGR
ncbi:MAG: hypothetical protein KGY99_01770 [Phycisphaerae bacterium]|nr:hypothetical protein [Phycisphaerae bacterium]